MNWVTVTNMYDPNFVFKPAKAGDVGHDLYTFIAPVDQTWLDRLVSKVLRRRVIVVLPFTIRSVRNGIRLAMPDDIWAEIRPRSSAARKLLNVIGGTIDSGYTGEMFTVIHNMGVLPRLVAHGERYSQVVFFDSNRPDVRRIFPEEFETSWADTARGSTGFGSTGS